MFERFTDRARRVVVLAQEEARHLNHNYIGTEHILLGLIHEGQGVAAKALESLGVSLEAVRAEVTEIIGRGAEAPGGHIPFTPRSKKVLELSLREALELGHNYIGTEHILLGLLREGEGVGAQVLIKLGAGRDQVRQVVVQLLSGYAGGMPPEQRAAASRPPVAPVAAGPGFYAEREPPELVRVVPLAREVADESGLRVVLISLEVWSGWFDLRYALLPRMDAPPPQEIDLDWRVTDDLGTDYTLTGLAAGGGPLLRVHQLDFRPAPPTDARTLTLTVSERSEAAPILAMVEIELARG
jgi:Clp amino terminal domain, pathogenicity island component